MKTDNTGTRAIQRNPSPRSTSASSGRFSRRAAASSGGWPAPPRPSRAIRARGTPVKKRLEAVARAQVAHVLRGLREQGDHVGVGQPVPRRPRAGPRRCRPRADAAAAADAAPAGASAGDAGVDAGAASATASSRRLRGPSAGEGRGPSAGDTAGLGRAPATPRLPKKACPLNTNSSGDAKGRRFRTTRRPPGSPLDLRPI